VRTDVTALRRSDTALRKRDTARADEFAT